MPRARQAEDEDQKSFRQSCPWAICPLLSRLQVALIAFIASPARANVTKQQVEYARGIFFINW
jgi:hypothetical protein